MLDLRPGNLPGLTRAAYLRELFGDLDGSVELDEHGLSVHAAERNRKPSLDSQPDRPLAADVRENH